MVGKTFADISGQRIFELEFYDYLGNPITSESSIVVQDDSEVEFSVGESSSVHAIGKRNSVEFTERWQIVDNKLVVNAATSTSTNLPITEVYYFALKELNTNDKSYTKFKYIQ